MNLVVGLGNPGTPYTATRHNIGFMAIDAMAQRPEFACSPWKFNKKFNADIAVSKDRSVTFLKPRTFMNESGRAVAGVARFYKIPPEHIWVIHDDLDLPFGSHKIQQGRGSAGHHGVESIFAHLGTRNFTRVRLGIDNSTARATGVDFVLSAFTHEERAQLPRFLTEATSFLLPQLHSPL